MRISDWSSDVCSSDLPRKVSDRIVAYALYTDPPLGRAGMSEAEARKAGRKILLGSRPMTRVGRAVEKGETEGFMKIVVDAASRQILGAAILGTGGDEVIPCILDHIYPTPTCDVNRPALSNPPTLSAPP